MKKGDLKKFLDKFWFVVWKDESLKGWIISIIFLFICIKFIFFPTLSFLTGTSLPLAIVESCSMYHKDNLLSNYDQWWELQKTKYEKFNLTKEQFSTFKFQKGFNKGDILFIVGANPEKLQIGDIIIFNADRTNPIIHRIINITQNNSEYTFSTLGDNNQRQLSFETIISSDQLVGKAVFRLAPYLGWGKLIFYEKYRSDTEKGLCE